jgi:alkylation response protein AidB-like acyl-CoA dehydrogenase
VLEAVTSTDTFETLLTPDGLSALMRSTWTWDDRALRRDLAVLLVDIEAAHAAADCGAPDHADALRGRALASGAEFVAAVLGPHLIADAGNALRGDYLAFALDASAFARTGATAHDRVLDDAGAYADRHSHIDYPPQADWLSMVREEGQAGLASAMRAFGHDLCDSNLFGNVALAWQALQAAGGPAATEYAGAIEAGSITATLAVAEKSGSWDPALVRTKASPVQNGWRLSGAKLFVPAAGGADVYFAIARSIAGPSLFAVERTSPGLRLTALDVVDSTRPLHAIEFADTPAKLVSAEGYGGRLMMTVIDLATNALAGEQVGIIEKAMESIGAAGSSSEELAAVTLDHVAAFSLWRRALGAQADQSTHASSLAATAHIGCSRAAGRATSLAARLLGPSEETDALVRRARSADLLFGGPAFSHERLLERLGV